MFSGNESFLNSSHNNHKTRDTTNLRSVKEGSLALSSLYGSLERPANAEGVALLSRLTVSRHPDNVKSPSVSLPLGESDSQQLITSMPMVTNPANNPRT